MDERNPCGHGKDDAHDCGHTDQEHEEMAELRGIIMRVQKIEDPRVALVVEDSGEVHFVTSLPPAEAAEALIEMAYKIKRYGGNYVKDHFDRGRRAQWN